MEVEMTRTRDEAEKRRERVMNCTRKKKEENLLKKEALVDDNIRRGANSARMNDQLAQMKHTFVPFLLPSPTIGCFF